MNTTEPMYKPRSLFTAMRDQIAATPLPTSDHGRVRPAIRRTIRPRIAVSGALASLAAAAIMALGLGALTGAAPAYAVTDNSDGTVTITLRDLQALPALNDRLAADDAAVRAVPVQAGCTATASVVRNGAASTPQTLEAHPLVAVRAAMNPLSGRLVSLTVRPPAAADQTLVIAVSGDGRLIAGQVVQGAVPNCVGESLSAQ